MARKQTPDIMSELMAGQEKASKPVKRYTSKTVYQHTGKTVKQRTSTPVSQRAVSGATPLLPEQKPIKATFYLSPQAIQALEQLWMKRRQKADPQQRGRISKS